LKIVFATSEVTPYSKTGGLADVSAALPKALGRLGHATWVVTPLYAGIDRGRLARRLDGLLVPMGADRVHADVWEDRAAEIPVFFVDQPGLYERPFLYGPPEGEYGDNAYRYAFLSRAALEIASALGLAPDVFHAHDWQTGLIPLFLRRHLGGHPLAAAATVFTIHNLGYQGLFGRDVFDVLGLGADLWHWQGIEFHGLASLLKAGILFADRLTTVSPSYAREIQGPEMGHGLDGILRERADRLHGILNGIDADAWDPAHDPHLVQRYSAEDLSGKRACKAALQREVGLPERADVPLVAIVSRLVAQKGWDLFAAIADSFLVEEVQLAVIGTGSPHFEGFFRSLATRYPGRASVRVGFDEAAAHRMEAGADLFLMPSRYEPCGLSQMYSLRYGTLPVVRATGGLEDTVVDLDEDPLRGNGFKFRGYDPGALLEALRRALTRYRDRPAWEAVVRRAMALDFSWARAAREYVKVYEMAIEGRP
jgi:starch synthase